MSDAKYRAKGIQQQNASVYCYTCHHPNYRFLSIDIDDHYVCARLEKRGFSKPCIVLKYMLNNPQIEWILLLDSDMGVVNLTRRLEHYLPSKEEKDLHLILYERFNGEIQSAGYFIRNHPWSHRFLLGWLDWLPRIFNSKIGSGDNAALHLHLLDHVEGVSEEKRKQCRRVFHSVTLDHRTYHNYIGCVKCALGYRWKFQHIKILRRGHAFARDPVLGPRLFVDHDLFIHGSKDNMTLFYKAPIYTDQCCHSQWELPIPKEYYMSNKTEAHGLMLYLDGAIAKDLPTSIGVPDIGHCWPNCTLTTDEYWKEEFFNKVCRNVTWLNI